MTKTYYVRSLKILTFFSAAYWLPIEGSQSVGNHAQQNSSRFILISKIYYRLQDKYYLTIRPVARKGYGSIAHEAKPNGLLTRGP